MAIWSQASYYPRFLCTVVYSGVWLTGQLNWTTRQKIYELSSLAKKKSELSSFAKNHLYVALFPYKPTILNIGRIPMKFFV